MSDSDDYQELIDGGIDDLNASENFRGTSFTKEAPKTEAAKPLMGRWWFIVLLLAAGLNAGLAAYYSSTGQRALRPAEADKQLTERFGVDPEMLAESDYSLTDGGGTKAAGPTEAEIASEIKQLNKAIKSVDGDRAQQIDLSQADRLEGGGLVWISPD